MQLPGHFVFIFLSMIPLVSTQYRSHCNSLSSCDECLSSPVISCAWCANKALAEQYFPSCDTPTFLANSSCPEDDIITSETSITISGQGIAVSPTHVVASLVPNSRKSFQIKVSPPDNYPVDIYMIFDNTRSMEPYLNIVKNMSTGLLRFIRSISNTSKFGFGTFVEKETIPFHFDLLNEDNFPGVSHAFENVLPLTSNEDLVTATVSNISLGTNDDQPENVLEAFIQSMACTNEIKWRKVFTSFRMIILMTDSEYHYALDGRLAGIVKPNNLQCSIKDGRYVNSADQDYPSILQFLMQLLEQNVLPVVITEGDYRELYEELFRIIGIENAAVILTTDLSNLLNTVQDIYTHASTSSHPLLLPENEVIQFKLTVVDCGGGVYVEEAKSCVNIPRNSSATYNLEVWLNPTLACSHGHNHPHGLDVRFQGYGVVNVTLNSICECPCSSTPEPLSPQCSSNGDLTCGICECKEGFSGPSCECMANTTQSCIEPGSTTVCSNKGTCRCGVCDCDYAESFGDYCHCDENLCPLYNGEICGGAEYGLCTCDGVCNCTADYENGPQGQCSCLKQGSAKVQEECTDPTGPVSELCSGFGDCVCGECKCKVGDDILDPNYEGKYCEICNLCTKSCTLLRPCLSCLLSSGSESCCTGTPGESIVLSFNHTRLGMLLGDTSYRACTLFDQDGCTWDYVIPFEFTGYENEIEILARSRVCSTPTWWPWLVLAFLIVTVAGVVIIILVRILVWVLERNEFKNFWNAQKKIPLPFQESPLYVPPVTEMHNPTYKKLDSIHVE